MYKRVTWLLTFVLTALLVGVVPTQMFAQSAQSASLTGKVTDASGAALAGVAIDVTSPALQVPKVSSVSDENGDYKVVDLPAPGVYTITVTLQGFQKFVRSGMNLSVGLVGRVDIPMKIGEVTQTVEVQGGSPVIDTVSTNSSSTLEIEEIQNTPKGLGLQELLPMSPGVSMQGPPDVGDSNLAARAAVITYGVVLVPSLNVEGINLATAKDADTAVYLDTNALGEVQFKTVGNTADTVYPGVAMEAVVRSGSNQFHGNVRGDYENPSFQGSNTTNANLSNPLQDPGYYDYAADIGGRVITDKLWFYGGYSKQSVVQGEPNFVGAPGAGCSIYNAWLLSACPSAKQATVTTSLREYDWKVSYQYKPRLKFQFTSLVGNKFLSSNGFNSTTPLVATQYQHQPTQAWTFQMQSAISSRVLVDARFGHAGYRAIYTTQPSSAVGSFGYTNGTDFAGSPSQQETTNKLTTGPYYFPQNRPQYRYEAKANLSFIPSAPHFGGTHQIKVGYLEDWENAGTAVLGEKPSGDYQLIFNTSSATTNPQGTPYRITLYNYPFPNSTNHMNAFGAYLMDSYTVKRVSFNIGLRGDRWSDGYPTQTKVAGQFSNIFPAVTYPGQNILTWSSITPRAGAAWDIFGNGKTVAKGSFGMFGDTMGDLFANTFNPNAAQSATYSWNGPCAATASLAPVEYNCDVTPGFLATITPATKAVAQTGGVSQVLNPGLKQDRTFEYAASFERQIVPNVSATFTFVNHHVYNLYNAATNPAGSPLATATFSGNGINVGHPLNSYIYSFNYNDTFNGKSKTFPVYYYPKATDPVNAALAGNNTNEVLNNPSNRPDSYNSFEVGITKKYSKRWTGFASYWMTKDHRWINGLAGIAGSPNDNTYPLDETWNWEFRGNLSYTLPKGFQVLTFYRAQSGNPGQPYAVISTLPTGQPLPAGYAAGDALPQGSTNIFTDKYGSVRGPMISVWNVKAAKVFKFKSRYSVEANFQVFNILNSNSSATINYVESASAYGSVSDRTAPRVARIGGLFSF